MEINDLVPLKFIRIANDMGQKEMAYTFEVSSAYISAIEKNERNIRKQTLIYGLNKLNINYCDYLELETLSYSLSLNDDINKSEKYKIMLTKAIGVINPELKEETERLIAAIYRNNAKNKKLKK